MAASRKWLFKNKLRAKAYGWRGSRLAISRLKEAASEIRSVAKSDSLAAGEGVVSLMERNKSSIRLVDNEIESAIRLRLLCILLVCQRLKSS